MPASCKITKEEIIKKAVVMVNKKGWDSVNARNLAASLKISTKPLYRIYQNMDEIKEDMYKEIYKQYDEFITSRVDNKKALVTLCVAYVEFAKMYNNLFISLFLSNNLKWKSVDDVLNEKWNQGAIINLVNKQGYTFEEAKERKITLSNEIKNLKQLLKFETKEEIYNSIIKTKKYQEQIIKILSLYPQ